MMATPSHVSLSSRDKSKGLDQDWEEIANMSCPFTLQYSEPTQEAQLIPAVSAVASI